MAESAKAAEALKGDRAKARRRLPRPAKGEACTPVKKTSHSDAWDAKLSHHRKRQASVASILDAMFGPLAECKPQLWERRAYLMLVGLVYERLATNEEEMPTDDLIALAKVLAENRRVEARLREAEGAQEGGDSAGADGSRLPDRFGDIVRQLYGTNFQQSDSAPADESSETSKRQNVEESKEVV